MIILEDDGKSNPKACGLRNAGGIMKLERFQFDLKAAREKAGITAHDLSVATGVAERTIVSMESTAGANPYAGTLIRILSYLKIPFEEIFDVEKYAEESAKK